MFLHLQTF